MTFEDFIRLLAPHSGPLLLLCLQPDGSVQAAPNTLEAAALWTLEAEYDPDANLSANLSTAAFALDAAIQELQALAAGVRRQVSMSHVSERL